MKRSQFIRSLSVLLALSAPAFAQTEAYAEDYTLKPYLMAAPGVYMLTTDVGVSGSADTNMTGGYIAGGVDMDWGSPLQVGLQLRASGSAEATSNIGAVSLKTKVKAPLWSVFVVPHYQFNEDWRLHALVGATLTPKYTITYPTNTTASSKQNTSFSYGVGGDYLLMEGLRIGAEWTRYHDKVAITNTINTTLSGAMLTLSYTFGEEAEMEPEPVVEKVAKPVVKPVVKIKPEPVAKPMPAPKPVPKPIPEVIELQGVNFETNSAELTAASLPVLQKAVATLTNHPDIRVEVAAHTDSHGREAYNQRLSEMRAKSVVAYLIQRGITADRLQAKGYGESMPIADNKTADGRAKNRRVELRVR